MRCGFHFFFFGKNALLLCVSSYLCYPKISSFFFSVSGYVLPGLCLHLCIFFHTEDKKEPPSIV